MRQRKSNRDCGLKLTSFSLVPANIKFLLEVATKGEEISKFFLICTNSIAEISHINNGVIELPRAVPSRGSLIPGAI